MSKKTLTQDEYKSEVKAPGARWKALSADEKADFNVLAAHQQSMLEELAHKPLPTKPESGIAPTTDEADQLDVWRNAQKKRSARRLDINSEAFERHPIWDSPTQLGDSLSVTTCPVSHFPFVKEGKRETTTTPNQLSVASYF